MKLIYIECNEAEMKANRTFIDALTDIAKSIVDTLNSPVEEEEGHWIHLDDCANDGYFCSECMKKLVKDGWSRTVKKIKFCPNRG